jgi:phosphohistidine phosphatase
MKKRSVQAPAPTRLLLLIRHGKAAPKDIGLSDFERVLTADGVTECRQMATLLASHMPCIDQILSSPADRALETAHLFAQAFCFPTEQIALVPNLYSSDQIKAIIATVKRTDPRIKLIALVGHNPMFDDLAAYFIPGFRESIDKSGVVAISFGKLPWTEIRKGAGQLTFAIAPSDNVHQKARANRRAVA